MSKNMLNKIRWMKKFREQMGLTSAQMVRFLRLFGASTLCKYENYYPLKQPKKKQEMPSLMKFAIFLLLADSVEKPSSDILKFVFFNGISVELDIKDIFFENGKDEKYIHEIYEKLNSLFAYSNKKN